MFTGLIERMGEVQRIDSDGAGGCHIQLTAPGLAAELNPGDSVAINGACLTVIERDAESFRFQAGPETLRRTNLGELLPGDRVNLERALRLCDRLGGHLVQGHIDGVGRILSCDRQGEFETVWFTCPPELATQMVSKGSIAVDGVSLTLVEVAADRFSVMLIPHTLANTTLGLKKAGATVNLETDLIGKYVRRLVSVEW